MARTLHVLTYEILRQHTAPLTTGGNVMKEKNEQRKKLKQYTIDQKIRRLRLNNAEKEAINLILTEPIGYIPYDHFRRPSLMAPIMKKSVEVTAGQTLDKEDERVLFLKMNSSQ